MRQIQRFDFDCNLVVQRKRNNTNLVRRAAALRSKPPYHGIKPAQVSIADKFVVVLIATQALFVATDAVQIGVQNAGDGPYVHIYLKTSNFWELQNPNLVFSLLLLFSLFFLIFIFFLFFTFFN